MLCFFCLFALSLMLIVGCSKNKEIPEGFSKQSYNDFTKIYLNYEKAKSGNKEAEGMDTLFEYREKDDKGKLSPQESKVREDLSQLLLTYNTIIKDGQNEIPDDAKEIADTVTEDKGEIPELEKEIADTLKLKSPKETKATSEKETDDVNKNNDGTGYDISEVDENHCPKPYTKKECKEFHDYYKNGDEQ
ncbi:hypothetical protein BJQ93_01050 [Bacillus subtilis]|nr:hypothetical protein [Bacillus subtilis]